MREHSARVAGGVQNSDTDRAVRLRLLSEAAVLRARESLAAATSELPEKNRKVKHATAADYAKSLAAAELDGRIDVDDLQRIIAAAADVVRPGRKRTAAWMSYRGRRGRLGQRSRAGGKVRSLGLRGRSWCRSRGGPEAEPWPRAVVGGLAAGTGLRP